MRRLARERADELPALAELPQPLSLYRAVPVHRGDLVDDVARLDA